MKFTLTVSDATETEIKKILAVFGEQPIADEEHEEPVAIIADGELDSEGLPWDARIHASTKTKTVKGVWKARKNVPDDVKLSVETELRLASKTASLPVGATPLYAPAPAVQTYPQHIPPQQQEVILQQPTITPGYPPYAAPEGVAVAQPQAQIPVQNEVVTFQQIMNKFQQLITSGRVDGNFVQGMIAEINAAFGTNITSLTDIASTPQQPVLALAMNILNRQG